MPTGIKTVVWIYVSLKNWTIEECYLDFSKIFNLANHMLLSYMVESLSIALHLSNIVDFQPIFRLNDEAFNVYSYKILTLPYVSSKNVLIMTLGNELSRRKLQLYKTYCLSLFHHKLINLQLRLSETNLVYKWSRFHRHSTKQCQFNKESCRMITQG